MKIVHAYLATLVVTTTLCTGFYSRDFLKERLNILRQQGFNPHTIYDIGAHKGLWTREVSTIFPQAQYILFEANHAHKAALESLSYPVIYAVLGDCLKEVSFYANNSTGDSMLKEQTSFYTDGNYREYKTHMVPLDALVDEYHLPVPDLVKIDVQGAELMVLSGGLKTISHAEIIILESNILQYNYQAPYMLETLRRLDQWGYQLIDIIELHYLQTGELMQVDLMFTKKTSRLFKQGILC